MTPSEEWITQEEAANRLSLRVDAVRLAVTFLTRMDLIETKANSQDRRYRLVRIADLPKIQKAVLGE